MRLAGAQVAHRATAYLTAALACCAASLAGRPAVVGHIRAGLFPRDMTLAPDGPLLVSNFDSGQVEAVDVATIPAARGAPG